MTTAAIAARMRDAHAAQAPCRLVGAGTWLDAGHPVHDGAAPVSIASTRGIVEYVPGDLTITAMGGTTLAELHEATRSHGQRLALDPYGSDAGTIGATVATNAAGPSAGAFGTPRDQVLGLTFVSGTGDVVRAGGRVVKNVAGFDLVRLCTGAWGTLGAITEVSLRLRAAPAAAETLAVPLDADDGAAVARAMAALRSLPFVFEAVELLDAACAAHLGLTAARHGAFLVRTAGSADVVRAMRASLATAGTVQDAPDDTWAALRALEPAGAASIRVSHAPAGGAATWGVARALAAALDGHAHMAVTRIVARVTAAPTDGDAPAQFAARVAGAIAAACTDFDGTVIAERLPAGAWTTPALRPVRTDGDVLARLTRGVRDAFDPARLLNRGILGAAAGDA